MKKVMYLALGAGLMLSFSSCDEEDPFGIEGAESEMRLAEYFIETEALASRLYTTADRIMRDSLFLATDSTSINGGVVSRDGNTISLDYGMGAAGSDGIVREGVINLVLTGNDFMQAGSEVAASFDNYTEDGEAVTGSFTLANDGGNIFTFALSDLSIGGEFSINASKNISWVGGILTNTIEDDVFVISGTTAGNELATTNEINAEIGTPVIYDATCEYGILEGTLNITLAGDELSFTGGSIDFVDSDGCNNVYVVSLSNIDGMTVSNTKVFKGF